jgi:carbonic anhydrase
VLLLAAPHAFGLPPPPGLGALDVLDHLVDRRGAASGTALLVAAAAAVVTFAGRRFLPRLPVGLVVVALAAVAVTAARLDVPTMPDLPLAVPSSSPPSLPGSLPVQFGGAVLVLWLLASAETLLSSISERDRAATAAPTTAAAPAPRDLDQDLIGHGLANLALAFAGGVPATGAAIRSRALGDARATGAAAAVVHALLGIPALVLVLVVDRFVPIAALAGVAVAHALPLLSPAPARAVLRASRGQAAILAVTAAVMLVMGLVAGIETGLALSLLAVLLRVGRLRVTVHRGEEGKPHQITFSGPLTFLISPRLEALDGELAALDMTGGVILDLRDVPTMDLTGARRLAAMVAGVVDHGGRVALLGLAPGSRDLLLGADARNLVAARLAVTELEVDQILDRPRSFELRAHVMASFGRFRQEVRERYEPLFEKLAEDQRPHTLFIGCVDSRVTPAVLTGTHPGELFVVRCLGAVVVPPGDTALLGGEAAAIEYAVGVLGVRNVVVCGHSRCGAIRAISSGEVPPGLDNLARWVAVAGPAAGKLEGARDLDQAARRATVHQLENLRRFPQVVAAVEAGALHLHAWFYDVGRAELYEWRQADQTFAVLAQP